MKTKSLALVFIILAGLGSTAVHASDAAARIEAATNALKQEPYIVTKIAKGTWNGACSLVGAVGNTVHFVANLTAELCSQLEGYTLYCRENPKSGLVMTCAGAAAVCYAYKWVKEQMAPGLKRVSTTTNETRVTQI